LPVFDSNLESNIVDSTPEIAKAINKTTLSLISDIEGKNRRPHGVVSLAIAGDVYVL